MARVVSSNLPLPPPRPANGAPDRQRADPPSAQPLSAAEAARRARREALLARFGTAPDDDGDPPATAAGAHPPCTALP